MTRNVGTGHKLLAADLSNTNVITEVTAQAFGDDSSHEFWEGAYFADNELLEC